MLKNLDPKKKKMILIASFVIIIGIVVYLAYKFLYKKQDDTASRLGDVDVKQGKATQGKPSPKASPRQGATLQDGVSAGEGKSISIPGENTPDEFKSKIGKVAVAKSSATVYTSPSITSKSDNLNTYLYTTMANERIGVIEEVFKQNGLWAKVKLSGVKKVGFVKNLTRAGATGGSSVPPYSGNADCLQKVREQVTKFGKDFNGIMEANCDMEYGYVLLAQINVLNIV